MRGCEPVGRPTPTRVRAASSQCVRGSTRVANAERDVEDDAHRDRGRALRPRRDRFGSGGPVRLVRLRR